MEKQNDDNNRSVFYASKVSLGIRVVTAFIGIGLLIWSFFMPPQGVIDKTVLFAFGEIATFVAALMWIDYHYIYKKREKRK
jgi:hypothetical protein